MAKQEISDVEKYNATLPTILRELMREHSTTQKTLAEELEIRPQTVSLYINGTTQPNPDTLVNIAKYFDVSVDYLLTGVSSYNRNINKELGLTEDTIRALKDANKMERFDGMPKVIDTINNLLSDGEFYKFIDELSLKVNTVCYATKLTSEQKHRIGNLDIEGYYIWDLQMYIQNFILKQLVKNGLGIEKE